MKPDTETLAAGLRIVAKAQLEFSSARDAINLAADRLEELERELGHPSDLPDANGSAFARVNWWKDRNDDLNEQLAESRQWSSKLADVGDDLRADLAAERALADRLASVLTIYNHDLLAGEMIQFVPEHDTALAAWKEARAKP